MGNWVHEAGWGIWPVFFFGIFGLVVSTRHALSPTRERLALVVGLALATVLMGLLGTVTGVQASAAGYIVAPAPLHLFLVGLRESLNNLVAALLLASMQILIATYGTHKLVRRSVATERG